MTEEEDRRGAQRFTIWFPLQISGEGEVIIGISRDISATGVMMVAAAEPVIGERVVVMLRLPGDELPEREMIGTIVRVEDNEEDSEGLWRHRVAVSFTEAIDDLEPLLADVSRSSQVPSQPPPPKTE
jgi:hypothetical protein